jgi:FkbM family methyltransferase
MPHTQDENWSSSEGVDFRTGRIGRFKHTEHHEQEWVRLFFGNATAGVFVDVGANDPTQQSQTYHLEHRGWRGLLIEPLPEMAERLRKERKAAVAQCAASSRANSGKRSLLKRAGVHSTLNTSFAARTVPADENTDEYVLCRDLDSILAEYTIPERFEFLSIDVEGHEPEVLDGFSIEAWKPRLILIEDHMTNLRTHRWLTGRSYRLILRTGHNSWYVPAARSFSLGIGARSQMLRKLYVGLPLRSLKQLLRQKRQ